MTPTIQSLTEAELLGYPKDEEFPPRIYPEVRQLMTKEKRLVISCEDFKRQFPDLWKRASVAPIRYRNGTKIFYYVRFYFYTSVIEDGQRVRNNKIHYQSIGQLHLGPGVDYRDRNTWRYINISLPSSFVNQINNYLDADLYEEDTSDYVSPGINYRKLLDESEANLIMQLRSFALELRRGYIRRLAALNGGPEIATSASERSRARYRRKMRDSSVARNRAARAYELFFED